MKLQDYIDQQRLNTEFVKAEQEIKEAMSFAHAVILARSMKKWSQAQLAEIVGTRQANISRIESGLANPTLLVMSKIMRSLDIDLSFVPVPKYSHRASSTAETAQFPFPSVKIEAQKPCDHAIVFQSVHGAEIQVEG